MLRYTCWTCAFTFYDADRSWDSAIDSGRCPKCSEPLYDFPVPVSGHKANPKALYEAVIGEKNRIYYITKFEQFDQQGAGLKASWNWPAFFNGLPWVVYRKMYGWVFPFLGVAFLEGFIKLMTASDPGNTITAWLGAIVILAPLIVFAIFADSLYYNRVKKKIAAAQLSIKDETELLRFLRYKGGVNTWVVWVSISLPVIGILAAIAIPAYGRMSRHGGELFLAALFFAALFLAGAFVWIFVMKKTAGGGKRIPSNSPSEDRTSSPRTEIHSMERVASDAVYLQIRTELDSGSPDVATWTRAQGDAEGNAERAKALYIKYRAERLLAASRTASTHQ